MAIKRKAAAKKPLGRAVRRPRLSGGKPMVVQATPAQLGEPPAAQKLSPEDTVMALMIAVAIAIVLAGLYLYQQNVKPKPAQAGFVPAIVVMTS